MIKEFWHEILLSIAVIINFAINPTELNFCVMLSILNYVLSRLNAYRIDLAVKRLNNLENSVFKYGEAE